MKIPSVPGSVQSVTEIKGHNSIPEVFIRQKHTQKLTIKSNIVVIILRA